MSQKRHQEVDSGPGGGSGEKRRKGCAAFRGLVMNVIRANRLQHLLSTLEPLLRRIVKEEVERVLAGHLISLKRQCGNQVYPSSSGSLQLNFQTTLRHPIYTGAKIEGPGGSVIVVLLDPLTGYAITSGPESSLVVEIVALEGDFEGDKEDNWTYTDFENNIVKERGGKRPLLAGDAFLVLTEGTSVINELSFTDNSSWTRSRRFRLGAKVENGHFNGTRIKEAKTEPFVVKDHRGELYKKHYPPSLEDEVWRLEKIAKDGAFHKRLSGKNINTVKEFLALHSIDPSRLRSILGSGMSNKKWEITLEHARKCVLTQKMYVYYADKQQRAGVVYNEISELKGVISEHQFITFTHLSDVQKADALKLLKVAHDQPHRALPYAAEDTSLPSISPDPYGSSLRYNFDDYSYSQMSDLCSGSLPINVSTQDVLSSINMECVRGLADYGDSPSISRFFYQDSCKPSSPSFDDSSGELLVDDVSQCFSFDTGGAQPDKSSEDLRSDHATAVSDHLKPSNKLTIGWGTLLCVLSWRFSIKRIVASKKDARPAKRGSSSYNLSNH